MVNSYTCVILWVLLEADFHKVSIYVINVPIVCQMAEIHANHRPTAVKTSYGPDFRGHFSTRHALFLFSPINSLTVSPWKIKDRKNKRVDTFVTHARVKK